MADHGSQPTRLHLESWALCPIAQRVLIAAALRGHPVTRRITSGGEPQSTTIEPTILTLHSAGAEVQVTDGLAMVELVEDLFPDHPLHPRDPVARAVHRNLMAIAAEAQTRLSRAARDRQAQDLDLSLGNLEAQLGRLEARLAAGDHAPGGRVANVDVVLAPLLWRLRILDEQAGTHLLQRFARLRGWSDWLAVQPVLRDILTAEAADLYFAVLHARRALIVDAEVSLAWQSVAGPGIGLRGAG